MDMEKNVVDVTVIKTEIDEELSEHSIGFENVMVVKNADIVEHHTDSDLEKSLTIKTEIKTEDTEETFSHEDTNWFEVSERDLKHEIKSEEIDTLYHSLDFGKEDPSGNWCYEDSIKMEKQGNCHPTSGESEERWQKSDLSEPSSAASNVMQPKKNVSFSCFHCDYSTNLKRNLINHIHSCPKCDYKTAKTHSEKHSCTCSEKHYKNKASLDNHIIKNHENFIVPVRGKIYNCLTCDYKTTKEINLRLHRKKIHNENSKMYACTCCQKLFKEKRSLDHHILNNHENLTDLVSCRIFNCETCDYKTTIKFLLRHHITNTHIGDNKKHLCTHCDKRFKTQILLDEHIIKNHQSFIDSVSSKIHSCPTCEYKTTMRSLLNRHSTSHLHSKHRKKYSCSCCEKQFKTKQLLDGHIINSHQNIIASGSSRVYKCTKCDYKTTIKGYLKGHRIKHLQKYDKIEHDPFLNSEHSRIHKCLTCKYRTRRKTDLRLHTMRMHSGDYKKHSCTYCQKDFKNKRSLDDHIVKCHKSFSDTVSSKIHTCPRCDYKTVSTTDLKRHTIKIHSGN